MDTMRDYGSAGAAADAVEAERHEHGVETPPGVGQDERRMHVRAYNFWVSQLHGRAYPSIEDLDPHADQDFGPNSVLLDFTASADNPRIAWLGTKLSAECALAEGCDTVAQVPPRSLLSRLTDHYLQIIANRAPIGFEAEFVNVRGNPTMYRGILMPYSSDDDTIDFVFGVINWKEVVADAEQSAIEAELIASVALAPAPALPAFADGPAHDLEDLAIEHPTLDADAPLADWLASARDSAQAATRADSRTRAALYDALGRAHDFASVADERAEEYAELLDLSGVKAQARAPLTPIVKLVFGSDYDKTRLTEFAAALSYARRRGLPKGAMAAFLDEYPGGLKAVVKAERRERRPADAPPPPAPHREQARGLATQALLSLPGDDEFVVLVARRVDQDYVAVVGVVDDGVALVDRAIKAVLPQAG